MAMQLKCCQRGSTCCAMLERVLLRNSCTSLLPSHRHFTMKCNCLYLLIDHLLYFIASLTQLSPWLHAIACLYALQKFTARMSPPCGGNQDGLFGHDDLQIIASRRRIHCLPPVVHSAEIKQNAFPFLYLWVDEHPIVRRAAQHWCWFVYHFCPA